MAGSLRDKGPLDLLMPRTTAAENPTMLRDQLTRTPTEDEVYDPLQQGNFARGMDAGMLGIESGQLYHEADVAEQQGDMETRDQLRFAAQQRDLQAAQNAVDVGSFSEVENLRDLGAYAAGGLGQLAPSMVATAPAGIAGGLVAGVLTGGNPWAVAAGASLAASPTGFSLGQGEAASSQQQDEVARNKPVEERLREQNVVGVANAALEIVTPGLISGRLSKSLLKIFGKLSEEGAEKLSKKTLVAQAKETARETISESATEGLQTYAGQQSLTRLNPERDTTHDVQEIIDAVILGGLGGFTMSGATQVPSALAAPARAAKRKYDAFRDERENAPGAPVSDADLDESAATGAPAPEVAIPDSDLVPEQGELDFSQPAEPEAQPEATPGEDFGKRATEEEIGQALSDAELERRSRMRQTVLGRRQAVEMSDDRMDDQKQARPEEVLQLRELKPQSKDEGKASTRYVRSTPDAMQDFLAAQVERGVISQEVADSATVEPLGQKMNREGASEQEMENTLAAIVRDIMTRIQNNKDPDFVKGLMNELESLPIDVQRRGEVTKEGATQTRLATDEDRAAEIKRREERGEPTTRRMKQDSKQGDLFPTEEAFPIPLSEFKKNHFGFQINPQRPAQQGELDLGPGGKGETYKQLLMKALDQYSTVLASDAAIPAQAATEAQTKARRRSIDSMTQKQRREAGRKEIRFRKKNGQTYVLDRDDMIQQELAANRDEVAANLRGAKQTEEAALQSAIASELLRNDVEGLLGEDGEVLKGSRVQDLLGDMLPADQASIDQRAANRAQNEQELETTARVKGKKPRDLGKEVHPYVRQLAREALRSKQQIQKAFDKAKNELDSRRAAEGNTRVEREREQSLEDRQAQIEALRGEAKAQRDTIAKVRKLNEEMSFYKRVQEYTQREKKPLSKAAATKRVLADITAAHGAEVARLMQTAPQVKVAEFRADRLEALAEHIQESVNEDTLDAIGEQGSETHEAAVEAANREAESQERYAEDHTGADRALKVGERFGGAKPGKTVEKTAAQRQAEKDRALEARLKEITEYKDATRAIEQAYGYKSRKPGLWARNATPIVLMGKLAKKYVKHAASTVIHQVETIGVAELLREGHPDQVTVIAGKSDMKDIVDTAEFGMLLDSGITIIMPDASLEIQKEFMHSGYKAQAMHDGTIAWVPAVGFNDPAYLTTRFEPTMTQHVTASSLSSIFNAISIFKQKDLSPEQQQILRDWFNEQMQEGYTIYEMRREAARKFADAGIKSPAEQLWGKAIEIIDKAIAEAEARWKEINTGEDPALSDFEFRAKIEAEHSVDVLAHQVASGMEWEWDEAIAWANDNYDSLIGIIVRRRLLHRDVPTYIHKVDGFAGDVKQQAGVIQKVFGKKLAAKVGIIRDQMELPKNNWVIKFEGEEFKWTKDNLKSVAAQVMAFMKKAAPIAASTTVSQIYWRQTQVLAQQVKDTWNGTGKGVAIPDLNSGTFGQTPTVFRTLRNREEIINEFFGHLRYNELKDLTWEELADIPIAGGVDEDMRNYVIHKEHQRISKISDETGKPVADIGEGPIPQAGFQSKTTLRANLEGYDWLIENQDRIDFEFSGDIESLISEDPGFSLFGGGPIGFFSPSEDKVFVMADNVDSEFQLAWVTWHELHHRGFAVKYGADVTRVLNEAAKNPTVAKIAKVIEQERLLVGDRMGSTKEGAVEEALVELAAAINMNNFEHIRQQYGVVVSENLRKPIESLVKEFIEIMKKVMRGLLELTGSVEEMKSDLMVLEILKDVRTVAAEAELNRKQTNANLKAKGIDRGFRYNEQEAEIEAALSEADITERQNRVAAYIERVLGDRVTLLFDDLSSTNDDVGYYDWKMATIKLAMNHTNWKGAARHEAFHAFFQALGKLDSDRLIYDRLLKAANAPHIKRQLRRLLAGHPEALAQLRDPEERAAYMFQFYASGELNLQPQTFKTLRKWARNLAKLVGFVSRMESAERIFEAFNGGELKTDGDIADMLRREQHRGLAKDLSSVTRSVEKAMHAVLRTATDRLRATNNKSLQTLADLYANTVKGGGAAGFLALRGQMEAKLNNQFNKALEDLASDPETRDEVIKQAMNELQSMKPDNELSPLAARIRLLMQRTYKYLRDEENDNAPDAVTITDANGVERTVSKNAVMYIVGWQQTETGANDYTKPIWEPIGFEPRYFPRVWDVQRIVHRWDEFKQLMQQEGNMSEEALDSFRAALEAGDGMIDYSADAPTFDAAMRAVNARVFDFITPENAHKFTKFQEQDMTKTLTTYARQAAHRAEKTRHFGYDDQVIKGLLKDAEAEGATAEELKMADKAVRALHGTLGFETMTPLKKNAMMTAMTVVNFAVLPLALFSSLVDPLGVAVRTGNMKAAWNTFKAGAQQIVTDTLGKDKSEQQKLAEFLGIVEQEQILSVIGDSYNSMFANERLQRANSRFFKIIGLDAWTKGTRIGAMVASMEYLKEFRHDEKRLAELGLKPGDIHILEDGQIDLKPRTLGQEKARRVQSAIYRMVDESILRPVASQRPIFMSDMRFMLLGHLKQFTFSFHNTIIKQVAKNVSDDIDQQQYWEAATKLAPLMMYVPFMMAADVLRSLVGGRWDDEEDKDLGDYIADGIQRSAVLGLGTFGLDAADDISYGGAPINTFLGPVIHKGARLIESGIDPDESFLNQATRLLPGYAFWKGWME